jgi:hypothetical protein
MPVSIALDCARSQASAMPTQFEMQQEDGCAWFPSCFTPKGCAIGWRVQDKMACLIQPQVSFLVHKDKDRDHDCDPDGKHQTAIAVEMPVPCLSWAEVCATGAVQPLEDRPATQFQFSYFIGCMLREFFLGDVDLVSVACAVSTAASTATSVVHSDAAPTSPQAPDVMLCIDAVLETEPRLSDAWKSKMEFRRVAL